MGDSTDELIDLANQVTPNPPGRELDMLLTAGERISMALLAMAIADLGSEARSFTGSQAGVITDAAHGKARIIDVTPGRITQSLADGHIAIVAGFQGVSQTSKDITTLGRGGSDTTAVALAAALHADVCEIYTDVDGVFTADPRVLPSARKLSVISSEEMLDLAANGSKILHLRCVEYARRYGIPIHVRSSWSRHEGTWIIENPYGEGSTMEAPIIAGVAHDRSEAKITVVGVPDEAGKAADIFTDGPRAVQALQALRGSIGFDELRFDDEIGKLSLVGAGMRTNPGISAKLFRALAQAGINIEMISTSEIRISVVTRADQLDAAVRAAHTAFDLDSAEGEAIVYGGTGR